MNIMPIYVCFSFTLLHLILPQYSQCVKAQNNEVQALLNITNAVGRSASIITTWDSSASDPCNWSGVTCSSFNRVISLNMSQFGLGGTLPSDSFASLTELTSLDLSYNSLTSPLPASISMLTQLHDLNLTSNAFSEEFPKDILSLKQLVKLRIDNNRFTGAVPEGISALSNLQELRIDNNRFTGAVPEGISALSNLQELWLGNNTITSLPKSLSSLIDLTVLSAWGNAYLKIAQLPSEWGLIWVNLTYLNLHDTYLTGTLPKEWGDSFTKLQKLHLYDNDLTGSIPESWARMTNLKELRMNMNKLSGVVPSSMQYLSADTVDFTCNFLQGPHPTFFNDKTTWKGNCFDSTFGAHKAICRDNTSCEQFLSSCSNNTSCEQFLSSCGNNTSCDPFPKKKTFPRNAIIGSVLGVVVILCGIISLLWWFKTFSTSKHDQDTGDWEVPPGVNRFTYKEIMKATKSFNKDSKIGEGGFGKVYLAQLDDNQQVAIKRASGVSFQDKDVSTLNWYRRLEIALAVAQGLEYLHTFANPPVIHRDLKPSNILLDDNMIAKVADFGISKANPEMDTHVSTRPAGTVGYLDPEYFLRRQLTTASDVYGYGVVLLELLTGQLAIDHKRTEDYNLVSWVNRKLKWNENVTALLDPRLGSSYPVDEYKQVMEIAIQCTTYDRNDRPKMQAVSASLEQILSMLQPPPEHIMVVRPPSTSSLLVNKGLNQTTNSLNDIKITYVSEVEPR